jgi:preprotein translocase subunit SecF
MIDIIGKRYWFFLISGVAILLSIIFLAVFGLKPGLEFSSGSMLTVSFEQGVDSGALQEKLADLGYDNSIIQTTGEGDFMIRTVALTDDARGQLEADLTATFGTLTEKSFQTIDPIVAKQTSRTTIIALVAATFVMLLYIIFAFRKVPKAFRYGTTFTIALMHDVLIAAGIFSLLGVLAGWEIDLMFITGILAVIGVSIDNTIVVFDRIRENVRKGISPSFEVVVNYSIVETLTRCLNTTITIVIATVVLLLFVGGSIQNFVWVLLIGTLVGTFDSVFVAPSLLVVWEQGEWGRFVGRKPHPART